MDYCWPPSLDQRVRVLTAKVDTANAKLDKILQILSTLQNQGATVIQVIADLVAQVAATKTEEASAIVAIHGILDRLAAAIAAAPSLSAEDRAALLQATSDLKASASDIAAAVVAIPADPAPAAPAAPPAP